ncbi:MAG: hypothetical protein CM1200mP22_32250 [Dehalococcoidia bacterium]|nr:MAG: hypothetical protein CM1200mP22_32250 [Dehalococcoidia bacterium]
MGGYRGGNVPSTRPVNLHDGRIDRCLQKRPTHSLYTGPRLLGRRREHARRTVAGPELEELIVDRVSRIVAGAYDATNGGFGVNQNSPMRP